MPTYLLIPWATEATTNLYYYYTYTKTMDQALVDYNVHLSDMVHLVLWFNQIAK